MMNKNRVKHFRTKKKLSQRQLAAAIGTSQQQIQRIETGTIATRLDLATKLSSFLGQPLDEVFPGTEKVVKKLKAEFKGSNRIPVETYSELSEHGIEADSSIWHFKALLRGHEEELIFEIPPAESRRIYRAVQHESESVSFVVFDTENARIAIKLGEMAYCQFLFDVGVGVVRQKRDDDQDEDSGVDIYFSGNHKRFEFTVEPDDEEEEDGGDFKNIFESLELDPQQYERLRFTDVDGEDVFLRAGDIALLKVPLWVVEPRLLDGEESDEDEEESSGSADPQPPAGSTTE